MTAFWGSRVTGAEMRQSGAILDWLLLQFENENIIDTRFARSDSNATRLKLPWGTFQKGMPLFFLFRFSFMFCFYKIVVGSHPIHTMFSHCLVQLMQNTNCWKTDLNFVSFISEYNPLVTIQAVMHAITADPAVFSNCTLGWNRWHIMNCQQIHLQMLTSKIRSWSGTPGTSIKKEIFIK